MAHLVLTIPEWREKAGQPRSRLLTRIEHDKARQRLETDEGSCSELPGIVALVQPVRLSWPTRDVGHAGVAISRKVGTRREKNKEREGLLRALRTKLPWGGQLGRELFKRNETSHFPRSPPRRGPCSDLLIPSHPMSLGVAFGEVRQGQRGIRRHAGAWR